MGVIGFRKGLDALREPYRSLVGALVDALREVFGERLVSVVVFGSVARGEARRDSDVDLVVVVEGLPRRRFWRQRLFEEAEERIAGIVEELWGKEGVAVDFSPILLTPEEARRHRPLYLDIVAEGVIVYDRGGFMERVLREMGERLERLGAKRVRLGKKWYWVLKEDYRFGEVIEV